MPKYIPGGLLKVSRDHGIYVSVVIMVYMYL